MKQTTTKSSYDVHNNRATESLYMKVTSNYQKIENIVYEDTYLNEVRKMFK